jgi:hypothetical protein
MSVLGAGSTAANVHVVRELAHGRWKAQALRVTLRLGVADVLADRVMPVGELASRVEVSEDGLRRLLRLMVALGVFEDAGEDGYRNNAASELLRADHPHTLRPFALRVLSTEYPLVVRQPNDRIPTP